MSTIPTSKVLDRRDAGVREVERVLEAMRVQVRERDRLRAAGAGLAELAAASAVLERKPR